MRDQVLDKLNFPFEDLGPQQVKNIARPEQLIEDFIAAVDAARSKT